MIKPEEHLDEINKLRQEFMGTHYQEWTQEDLKRFLNQPQTRLLLFEYTELFVGLAVLNIVESLTRKSLIIEDFIIDKNNRGMGFGTELLNKIVKLGREIKADCIEVNTKKHNEVAKLMYKEAGFEDRKNLALRLWLK